MRFLLISDIHGDALSLEKLLGRERAVSAIIAAGDLTDFEEGDAMLRMVNLLREAALPVLAVPGNCDRRTARAVLDSSGFSIDNRSRRVDFRAAAGPDSDTRNPAARGGSINFFGMGGGGFRTGFTPYERREDEFERIFASCPESGPGCLPLVIVTHTPPRGTQADLRRGAHVGSPALAAALARIQPLLWVCGHIHEARSASMEGSSLLVNPGPLREGCYAIADICPPSANTPESGAGFSVHAELRSLFETYSS